MLFGIGLTILLYLYFFSYKPPSYNNLVLYQYFFPTKEKVLIYGATTYFGGPFFSEDIISKTCSKEIEVVLVICL